MTKIPVTYAAPPERSRKIVFTRRRGYVPVHRGETWRAISERMRAEAGKCAVCGEAVELQVAHLIAEYELFLLGCQAAYVFDERNLCVLCADCHDIFDRYIGVKHGPPLNREQRRYFKSYRGEFHAVLLARLRFVVALIEAGAL